MDGAGAAAGRSVGGQSRGRAGSVAAWERARHTLPGGVSTGLRASMQPHPLFFERGEGAELVDVDGNRYIDYVLGWGPVVLGHAHPDVTAAVCAQAARGATYGAGHALEYLVAEQLVAAIPAAERVLFSNTGSEANQVALRLARAATGRRRFVKFDGNYHGWTDPFLLGYRPVDGDLHTLGTRGQNPAALADVQFATWGRADELAAVLADDAHDIAAVFVEPVLCNSGVLAPPPGFLDELRRLCSAHGVVLIFDEVITGFRVGFGGAGERYGVTPDLVVLAKAVAAGYPLSAVVGRADLIDQSLHGVVHAGTYNGNPIVLAAAHAAITALGAPGVYGDFERRGGALADGMRASLQRHGVAGTVHHVGSVLQLALGTTAMTSFAEFLTIDAAAHRRLEQELVDAGAFVLPGGRWYLSTAHDDDHIARTLSMFDTAVAALADRSARP